MQVPFSTRGQGGPVKWEDGAEGPGATVKGCYWGILDASLESEVWQESPTQLLLPGAHQHFHPRLHHQGQNGNDLEAVTTITKARWDKPDAPLTSGCSLHSESSLSPCPTFLQPKDKDKQSLAFVGSLSEALLAALTQYAQSKMCLEVREVSQG